ARSSWARAPWSWRIAPRDFALSRTQALMAAMRASRPIKSICKARMPKRRLRSDAGREGGGAGMGWASSRGGRGPPGRGLRGRGRGARFSVRGGEEMGEKKGGGLRLFVKLQRLGPVFRAEVEDARAVSPPVDSLVRGREAAGRGDPEGAAQAQAERAGAPFRR